MSDDAIRAAERAGDWSRHATLLLRAGRYPEAWTVAIRAWFAAMGRCDVKLARTSGPCDPLPQAARRAPICAESDLAEANAADALAHEVKHAAERAGRAHEVPLMSEVLGFDWPEKLRAARTGAWIAAHAAAE